jgi:hypothetical protein
MFSQSLSDESKMIGIADIYPKFDMNEKKYNAGDIFSYGLNKYNETQLYKVISDHTSSDKFMPDSATNLYKKLGVDNSGNMIWVEPLDETDAYDEGDIAAYNGELWKCVSAKNKKQPGGKGWEKISKDTKNKS